jgi:hypothetical protein
MAEFTVRPGEDVVELATRVGLTVDNLVRAYPELFSEKGKPTTLIEGATFNTEPGRASRGNLGDPESDRGGTPAGGGKDSVSGAGGTDSNTGDPDVRFVGLPGRPEIWEVDGKPYVVHYVPGYEPPLPMLWSIGSDELLQSYFGDNDVKFDTVVTQREVDAAGGLNFGVAEEVVLRGANPFLGWVSQFEREMEVMPWLEDPEVAALYASSWLEGRDPTEGELASTDWFQSKTAGEQQWIALQASQPETAKQKLESNRLSVRNVIEQAGIAGAPEEFVHFMADKWTQGAWTETYMMNQIALFADPEKTGKKDAEALEVLTGVNLDTTQDRVKYVEDEVRKWLGPVYGQWDKNQISQWAGKLRNDPDAADAFQKELSRQRMAVLPQYENETLTYEDIATPWRNYGFSKWGQQMDETSDEFQQMIAMNDTAQAGQMLREKGLTNGIKKVEDDFMNDLQKSFGGGVRGYAR